MPSATTEYADDDRRERIEARVTPTQKDLLEQAAIARGLPLDDFITESLERIAAETLHVVTVINLSPEDSAIVADAFLTSPEPTPALRDAIRRYGRVSGLITDDPGNADEQVRDD